LLLAKAGDFIKAAKLLVEAVYQLPPGGFDSLPVEVAVGAKLIRAKIVHIHRSLSGSTGTFEIDAEQIEDRGKRPGHREADEDDF
jgi:hypothetical protein